MAWLTMPRWSPYAVGICIGVLSWITFLLSDKAIGCSTAYARTSGMIERLFRGDRVLERDYFRKYAPVIDWGWMLVLGVVIGAAASSLISGEFALTWVPEIWRSHIGGSGLGRWLAALLGGVLMGFGSRWAGGCTSGHGISGTLQLVVSSWVAAICYFVGGIVAAHLIFGLLW